MTYPPPSVEGDIQHLLTEELGEQAVTVQRENDTLVLRGDVLSERRRDAIVNVVRQAYPQLSVRCELAVLPAPGPTETEELA